MGLSEAKVGVDKLPESALNNEKVVKTYTGTTIEIEDEQKETSHNRTLSASPHNLLVVLVEFEDVKLTYSDE